MREWFTAQELVCLPGVPKTLPGVRYRAKSEDWRKRKRAKGKGFEYHIDSLPREVKTALILRELESDSASAVKSPAASSPAGGPGRQADRRSTPSASGAAASQGGEAAAPFDVQGAKDYFYDCASDEQRAEAQERLDVLNRVHALVDSGLSKRAACGQVGVPFQTYYNWMRLVKGHDHSDWLELLCPGERGGNNYAEFSDEAKQWLRNHWLDRGQPTKADSISRTIEAAAAHGWSVPSERVMYRYLDDLDPDLVRRAREGRDVTAELIPPQRRSVLGLDAGAWVNGDGLKLDRLWVKFPDGEIVNGATLWVNQDIRTRRLLNAELGKTETKDLFRLSVYGLTAICLPTDYVVDNTRAASNNDMMAGQEGRRRYKHDPLNGEGLMKALGTRVHFTNPDKIFGRPGTKPIERAFRDWHPQIMSNPKLKNKGFSRATAVPAELVREVVEFELRRWNSKTGRDTEACRGVLSFDQAWEEAVAKKAPRQADPRRRRLLTFGREVVQVYKRHNEVRIKAGATSRWGYHRYTHAGLSRFRGERLVAYFDPKNLRDDLHLYTLQGHRYLFSAEHIPNVAFNDASAAGDWRKIKTRDVKAMKQREEHERNLGAIEMQQLYDQVELPDGPADPASPNVHDVDFRPIADPSRDSRVAGSDVQPDDAGIDDDYELFSRAVRKFTPRSGH